MSTAPTTIRRTDKTARAVGFERLLAQGLQQLQQASGELWTDHNLHDPGITVLEQLCFALTELAYRADLPITDHLASPDGNIDLEALALHPPEQALPCRATTVHDYRRLFLDRVQGLDDAHMQPATADTDAGIYRLKLRVASGTPFSPQAKEDAAENLARRQYAMKVYRAERNLCEDLGNVDFVKDRRCDLHGRIEITGTREAAEIVADIYHRVARWIDRGPRMLSRQEMRARRRSGETDDAGPLTPIDEVYDGPPTKVGFVQDEDRDHHLGARLYLADLANVLRAVDGVKEVHDLALELGTPANAGPSRGSVAWGGEDWALRLHIPSVASELHLTLRRRALEVPLPRADELWRRVRNLRVADLAQRSRLESGLREEEQDVRPRGTYRPLAPHLSVQHDFPSVYALGKHALPASASAQRKARVHQLRAYLLMFDQLLANGNAQLHHLRDLYAVRGGRPTALAANATAFAPMPGAGERPVQTGEDTSESSRQTYWWQALDPECVPGLDELLVPKPGQKASEVPEQLASEVGGFFDRSSARKTRLLDHVLALHGETLTQNALRQYCGHLRSDELDRRLLDNKARFLECIVELSRSRAAGFDYSAPLWDNPENFSGLARRMCLLLGFKYDHARSLTQALSLAMLPVVEAGPSEPELDPAASVSVGEQINVVDGPEAPAGLDPMLLLAKQRPRLLAPLLRAGARHDGYRMRGTSAETEVTVGPDEQERTWLLGRSSTRALARAWAKRFRQAFVEINDQCEGLHLVEHVLLRPLQPDSAAHAQLNPEHRGGVRAGDAVVAPDREGDVIRSAGADDVDFYALRLTVVMPNWTVRTHQEAFRQLADETLRINLPVHLSAPKIVWLDYQNMVRFEDALARWLNLRVLWCQTSEPALAKKVDAAACEVIRWIAPGGPLRPKLPGATDAKHM